MPRPDKYLPVDPAAKRVRVELPPAEIRQLAILGAPADLTVSAVARVALSLLAAGRPVSPRAIFAEAERLRKAYAAAEKNGKKIPEQG